MKTELPVEEGRFAIRTAAIAAAVVITALSFEGLHRAASAGLPGEAIDRTVPAKAEGKVIVENVSGTVAVVGWDQEQVHVGGLLGRGAERVEVTTVRPGEVVVRVVLPAVAARIEGTRLEVHVPRASAVALRTVSADMALSHLTGEVDVVTTSGDLRLAADCRALRVESVSGDLLVAGNVPRLAVRTVSGDVTVEGRVSETEVTTVSGDVSFSGAELRAGSVHSVSGTVRYDGRLVSEGEVGLASQSGDIELALPKDDPVELDIDTRSGEVQDSLLGSTSRATSRGWMGSTTRASQGSAGSRVRVSTLSGDVHIRPRV